MKNSTLLLMFLTLISLVEYRPPSGDRPVHVRKENPQLAQRGKFLYYRDGLFSGVVEEYNTCDLKKESEYSDGLLEGHVVTWYPVGSLESVRTYSKGEKEGVHKGWWPNGHRMFEYNFEAGNHHGTFKEWYESGKPLHDFEYDRGVLISAIGWRENSKAYINFVVRAGRKYGLTNARLCYSIKDENGSYTSTN
jgi:antitoxin component YwqK of YwqJK toxin-antitoxin module